MEKLNKIIKIFEDPLTPDDVKAKKLNELNESFDSIIHNEANQASLDYCLDAFLKYLNTTPCQFHSESPVQKVKMITVLLL